MSDEKEMKVLADQIRRIISLHREDDGISILRRIAAVVGNEPNRAHLIRLMLYNLRWGHIEKWIEEVNLDEQMD